MPELPTKLPTGQDWISNSEIEDYIKCSAKWYRKYVLHEQQPSNMPFIMGGSCGTVITHAYQTKIETGEFPVAEWFSDTFSDAWSNASDVEMNERYDPAMKDQTWRALLTYCSKVLPYVKPVSVEKEYLVKYPDVEWGFRAYLDLEGTQHPDLSKYIEASSPDAHDSIINTLAIFDTKLKSSFMRQNNVDGALQAIAYQYARVAVGLELLPFAFHQTRHTGPGGTPAIKISPTPVRTLEHMQRFESRLFGIVAQMDWRARTGNLEGAVPGEWWCSRRWCHFAKDCQFYMGP